MATVIDSLVVELGMDPKDFMSAVKSIESSLKGIEKSITGTSATTQKASDSMTEGMKKSGAAAKRAAEDYKKLGKEVKDALGGIRNQMISLFALFTGTPAIKNFVVDTIEQSAALGRMSNNLGIATEKLMQYQKASRLAGAASDGLLNQLKANQKETSAVRTFGGNSNNMRETILAASMRHMSFIPQRDAKDPEVLLRKQAEIIGAWYKEDPGQAQMWAERMGINPGAFEAMKGGTKRLEELLAAGKKYANVSAQDAKNADKLRMIFDDLKDSFRSTAVTVLLALTPAIKAVAGVFKEIEDVIVGSRNDIRKWATDVSKEVLKFVKAYREGKFDRQIATIKELAGAFLSLAKAIAAVADAPGRVWDSLEAWGNLMMGRGFKSNAEIRKEQEEAEKADGGVAPDRAERPVAVRTGGSTGGAVAVRASGVQTAEPSIWQPVIDTWNRFFGGNEEPAPRSAEAVPAKPVPPTKTVGRAKTGKPLSFKEDIALLSPFLNEEEKKLSGAIYRAETINDVEGRGYNAFNRWGRDKRGKMGYIPHVGNLTDMTVGEIMRKQSRQEVFAVGRYQVTTETMKEAFEALNLSKNQKFNEETQDKIFKYLANRRPKLEAYLQGYSDDFYAFQEEVSKEWRGVAHPKTGKTYKKNDRHNRAKVSTEQFEEYMLPRSESGTRPAVKKGVSYRPQDIDALRTAQYAEGTTNSSTTSAINIDQVTINAPSSDPKAIWNEFALNMERQRLKAMALSDQANRGLS
ncbi:MAG: hypothetical protein LBK01_09050 [Burkholderiaceae bacterium]|jgi:hypothetical protein|nr:hypothetical protein [Burkholderiaceae bacterium]